MFEHAFPLLSFGFLHKRQKARWKILNPVVQPPFV
jgi:hypothetical protein